MLYLSSLKLLIFHMNKNGFTLMELVVAVAVVSGLAAVAVPSYQNYVARTQAAEAEKLINAERVNLFSSMQKGHCLAPGAQSTQKGRFGVLTTSGTFVASKGLSCDSGCDVTYTFNADANKHIAGKKVSVDVRQNGDISKNASTTVDQRYLSDNLNRVGTVNAGDNCTALSITKPTATEGSGASGTENGVAMPTNPSNGGNAGNGGESAVPEVPTPSGNTVTPTDALPNGIKCTDKFEQAEGETLIILGSAGYTKAETSYFVRNSINLYDVFVDHTKRAPLANEKVKFVTTCAVAFVGDTLSTPAIRVGNFGSSVKIQFINFGAILGRGGTGAKIEDYKNRLPAAKATPGGSAFQGGTASLHITNAGIIAGGGGGGADGKWQALGGGGGGAPYGEAGTGNYSTWHPSRIPLPGTFEVGGGGGYMGDGRWGGQGGGWGYTGQDVTGVGKPAVAGKAIIGSNITVVNIGTGIVRGS